MLFWKYFVCMGDHEKLLPRCEFFRKMNVRKMCNSYRKYFLKIRYIVIWLETMNSKIMDLVMNLLNSWYRTDLWSKWEEQVFAIGYIIACTILTNHVKQYYILKLHDCPDKYKDFQFFPNWTKFPLTCTTKRRYIFCKNANEEDNCFSILKR